MGFLNKGTGVMTESQRTAWLQTACLAARQAGCTLLHWRRKFTVDAKGLNDFVTEADLAAQQVIADLVRSHYPDHGFLGEETSAQHQRTARTPESPTWIVDPLDGTTNYVHDVPFFAVSIGLERRGEVLIGVVYDPVREELFHASRGAGAWLAGQALRVSPCTDLRQALVAASFPADMRGKEQQVDLWKHLAVRTAGLRRTGSSALNLAYLAAGRFDAFYSFEVCPWDVAGGLVLLSEAGGRYSTLNHEPFKLDQQQPLLATNGPLHDAMDACFRHVFGTSN